MSAISLSGRQVPLPIRARPERPTVEQMQARRNAIWLHAVEVGKYDPATNMIRRWTVSELALLYEKSTRTIQLGIASARRLREALAHVAL
jgi:hypothetical protein